MHTWTVRTPISTTSGAADTVAAAWTSAFELAELLLTTGARDLLTLTVGTETAHLHPDPDADQADALTVLRETRDAVLTAHQAHR